MKLQFLCIIFMLAGLAGYSQSDLNRVAVDILPGSSLKISGTTNINDFDCIFDSALIQGKKNVSYRRDNQHLFFKNCYLKLKNSGFDCGKKAINKDFHKLIKTEEYPEILLHLKQVKMTSGNKGEAKTLIRIAGKEKSYRFPIEIHRDKHLRFKGNWVISIKDFDLEPPHKLFGLIKVKDDINIKFNLKISRKN